MSRNDALRSYHFRRLVSERDVEICKSGDGPMVLTWAQARYLWKAARWIVTGQD